MMLKTEIDSTRSYLMDTCEVVLQAAVSAHDVWMETITRDTGTYHKNVAGRIKLHIY